MPLKPEEPQRVTPKLVDHTFPIGWPIFVKFQVGNLPKIHNWSCAVIQCRGASLNNVPSSIWGNIELKKEYEIAGNVTFELLVHMPLLVYNSRHRLPSPLASFPMYKHLVICKDPYQGKERNILHNWSLLLFDENVHFRFNSSWEKLMDNICRILYYTCKVLSNG